MFLKEKYQIHEQTQVEPVQKEDVTLSDIDKEMQKAKKLNKVHKNMRPLYYLIYNLQ